MPKTTKPERVQIRLHPRVFESLGSDLVTSDYVAITELVKNAYDAFATRVDIRIGSHPRKGQFLEIVDDGQGMSRETVEGVWCVVATPFRKESPVARKGKKLRRVSGEKGLGRLSVARLGDRLEMVTSTEKEPWLKVRVYWPDLSNATSLTNCTAEVSEEVADPPDTSSGTRLRIYDLRAAWTPERVEELRDHLSRLVSPFSEVEDFGIWLHPLEGEDGSPGAEAEAAKIDVPKFLNKPKFRRHASVSC